MKTTLIESLSGHSSLSWDDAIRLPVESDFGYRCLQATTGLQENRQVSMNLQDHSSPHDSLRLSSLYRVIPLRNWQTLFSLQPMRLQLERHPIRSLVQGLGSNFRQRHVPSELALFSDGFVLSALNISTGKSANPIIRLPRVPRSAEAPPDMGSHGPSSESYSRGRYLVKVSSQF